MAKVIVYDWARECGSNLDACGFTHASEHDMTDEQMLEAAKKIFDSGLNVGLFHTRTDSIILAVDTKRFQQR